MKERLRQLHNKIGDFWWYSLMLFIACRAADFLNAFVGLWLVPKYVDPAELGAVTPLANYANFLAIPVAVFANTFRNEFTRLTVSGEFGKLKTLMRGVFIATAVFLFVAIVASRFLLPLFLERIRIVEGSLGFIILAASFVGTVAPIYSNAIQSLKKFKSYSIINFLGAPIRLITMLIAMPFRAISGYFVGQAATPAFNIVASVFCLRKELSVKAEPYWNREMLRRFSRLLIIFGASAVASGISSLVEATVLRQRLPDIDSAGYYMATRFSEIAAFLNTTLVFTIFPFTAEMAAKGKSMRPLLLKTSAATVGFCVLVAVPFFFIGKPILAFLPHGEQYAAYWWAIPWQVGIISLTCVTALYTTAAISAERFGYMKWMIPINLLNAALLLAITGYGYFTAWLPESWTAFLSVHNITNLTAMMWWLTAGNLIRLVFIVWKCSK
jgi:O-antigen/teichoic acid export membrane protein